MCESDDSEESEFPCESKADFRDSILNRKLGKTTKSGKRKIWNPYERGRKKQKTSRKDVQHLLEESSSESSSSESDF